MAENSAFSTSLTANETVTWAIVGGADASAFALSGSTLSMAAKDFETPQDTADNGTNTYSVTVQATDTAGNVSTQQTITVTVTDVAEATSTTTFNDTFTGTAGASIAARAPDKGANWSVVTGGAVLTAAGRARATTRPDTAIAATPASANFDVSFDAYFASNVGTILGVFAYASTSTFKVFGYNGSSNGWIIGDNSGTTITNRGTPKAYTSVAGETHAVRLEVRGLTATLFIDNVQATSYTFATGTTLLAPVGLRFTGTATETDATGGHADNFRLIEY